jgi:hypothetical protein
VVNANTLIKKGITKKYATVMRKNYSPLPSHQHVNVP